MSNKTVEMVIRGKAHYAKILGKPVPNYSKDGFEWKMDLEIDDPTVKELRSAGIGDRVKQKEGYLDGGPYLTLKQRAHNNDGEPNKPPRVVDKTGKPWSDDDLIGNESTVDTKIAIVDYGVGKKKGVYIRGVRVLDHVPYKGKLFDDLSEDDEFFAEGGDNEAEPEPAPEVKAKGRGKKVVLADDLDDEIPFD